MFIKRNWKSTYLFLILKKIFSMLFHITRLFRIIRQVQFFNFTFRCEEIKSSNLKYIENHGKLFAVLIYINFLPIRFG